MDSSLKTPWVRKVLILDNDRQFDEHTFRRLQFINVLSYIGIVTLMVFIAVFNTTFESTISSSVTIMAFLGINILARHGKHPEVVFQLAMAAFVFSASYGLVGSSAERAVMWAPVYPFIAYLFLKMKGVVQWSLIAIAINMVLVVLSEQGVIGLMVDARIVSYATVLNIVSSIILLGYQSVTNSYERRVAEQEQSLIAINKQLKREKTSVDKKIASRTAQLVQQTANLNASIESLSSGYLMLSSDKKRFPLYNSAFLHILGIYRTDSPQLSVSEIFKMLGESVHKKTHKDLKDKIKQCIKQGLPFHIDKMVFGHSIVFAVDGRPIRLDDTGEATGCVMLFTDKTELEEIERSKNEFISIASHELRTPLTAIRGNATMLKDVYGSNITDPDAIEMVDDIKDASVRLISVVNGFLDMSRIEQNKIELDIVSTPPAKQIKAALDALSNLAAEKKIKIKSELPDKLPNILADPQRFLEIISNLVDNAIKYSERGTIIVGCEIEPDTVTFLVTDTGKGIPEASKKHIFKKFRQAGNNIYTRDVSRSTGLGLYICKLLTKQMHGDIFLKSSVEGKGSTFALKMPIDIGGSNG